jgi:hypothetical protein
MCFVTATDLSTGYERYHKLTPRDKSLRRMGAIVPWDASCSVIHLFLWLAWKPLW